jgi:N-methylhydantoinase A/oxoprolinase/acetone carboxylase beta subunit
LLLGYLDGEGSLSGAVSLRPALAERAIEEHIAKPLGMSVIEAANGIHRIVCEHMASAAKIHAVENGRDVRRYTLLAFGGAGPIHAREVARRSGCAEVLVPANAGVFSAFGLLVAPMKVDMVRTRFSRLAELDWPAIEALLLSMETPLRAELASAGVPQADIQFRRTADMRYVGQGFEVETELPAQMLPSTLAEIEHNFQTAYAARFGKPLVSQRIEVVNWRVEGSADAAVTPLASVASAAQAATATATAKRRSRPAYFPDIAAFVETPVLTQSELQPGQMHDGPALVEQPGSTVVVGPGDRFMLDEAGNLRIRLQSLNAQHPNVQTLNAVTTAVKA